MISVLLPSRGRAHLIHECLLTPALRPLHLDAEVLIRLDNDDEDVQRYIDKLEHLNLIASYLSIGEPLGYRGMHHYYNELAAKAKGDWLLLWNDDCLMQTEDWAEIVESHDHTRPCVLNFRDGGGQNIFPCVSRPLYEAIGHMAGQCHVDTWLEEIGRLADCTVLEPRISIRHIRDELDDATKKGSADAYPVTIPEFWSEETQRQVRADAEMVQAVAVL